MADPATIGALGIGATLLGGATNAAASEQTAQANYQQNQYQSQVALINQQIFKQDADYARYQGDQQAEQYGISSGQNIAQTKAAQSSSGFDVNSGSSARVRGSEATVTNINLGQIRWNAAMTAYNYDVQATAAGNQSTLFKMAGSNALQAGNLGVVSSIAGTASSVSSKWLQAGQVGMFGNSSGGLGGSNYTLGADGSLAP